MGTGFKRDGLALLEPSGANLRALQILKNTDGALQMTRDAAQSPDSPRVLCMRAVGKIQAGNIHPELHQVTNAVFGIAGRTNGADDLGATHARAFAGRVG